MAGAWRGLNKLAPYRCKNCRREVRWNEDYCYQCLELPERRCLDCGATTRPGTMEYKYPDTAPTWDAYREAFAPERDWTPKAPKPEKPQTFRNMVKYVVPGPCVSCGSTNLAKLEFGLDRIPEAQRTCSAWPSLSTDWQWRSYGTWLEKAADDPRIKPRLCASCHKPLYDIKGCGKVFGAKLTPDGKGIRNPRVYDADGVHWHEDRTVTLHYACPDPEILVDKAA